MKLMKDEHLFVYGVLKNTPKILLPESWEEDVDLRSIVINLTPIGAPQVLFVNRLQYPEIVVESNTAIPINCYYTVCATKLIRED